VELFPNGKSLGRKTFTATSSFNNHQSEIENSTSCPPALLSPPPAFPTALTPKDDAILTDCPESLRIEPQSNPDLTKKTP
jgi:hypothetical protein